MATFRKRGKKWSYRIDMGRDPVTNERIQPTISKSKEFPNGFSTKKEAQQAAAAHQYELDKGTYVAEKDMLFSELVASWMLYYQKTGVKPATVRIRKHESKRLMDYFGENRKAKDITKKMYQDALIFLADKFAPATLEGIHTAGRMVFAYAAKFDIVKIDPTEHAKVPREQKTVEQIESTTEVPKYLEKDELGLLLRTAREQGLEDDYAIFLILAYSGIRAGELCALKWTDLDFAEQTISITKTYYNPNNNIKNYELVTPKTTTSIRKFELAEVVFNELKNVQARQNELKMAHRKIWHNKDFVLVNQENYPGYPLYIKFIENRMFRLLGIAGLETALTPHSLRHTHTSLLAEAKVDLQEIMERLGHKDDDVTKNVYMHVTKTMKKEASHKFEKLMQSL